MIPFGMFDASLASTVSAFIGNVSDTAADSLSRSFTFNGGTRNGMWVVCILARKATAGTEVAPSSVTFKGVTLTPLVEVLGGRHYTGIFLSPSPIAASGSDAVVATWASVQQTNTVAALYSIDNLSSTTPVATASSTTSPATLNVNTVSGGTVIACGQNASTAAFTWTGAVENFDFLASAVSRSAARADVTATETPRTVSATHGTTDAASASVSLR